VVVKIAGGGMATIYLGRKREARGEERVAALKVIRHELGHDEAMQAMFHDEAKILARMSHPNIAAHWEHGIDDEQHFIAMELLVGRTLRDVWDACKTRKVSLRLDHAAWITARVADALHHAHELKDDEGKPLNVVHRDVNPTNIFLTFEGEVKLFDFGLAKASGRRAKSTAGVVKGKLPYLSPEAIEQMPLDGRSDIYTLGTTLWELTTMRRLFVRNEDVETLMATRAGLVPDPRARLPEYPEELWRILRCALARNRDERYQTAGELASALDAFVETQGTGDEMMSLTSAILDALFPGEREKRAMWLRHTSTSRPQRTTLPPPVPVAGVSDSMPPPLPEPSKRPSSKHRVRKA
jgi:serine/threonine-protein kinase